MAGPCRPTKIKQKAKFIEIRIQMLCSDPPGTAVCAAQPSIELTDNVSGFERAVRRRLVGLCYADPVPSSY